MQQIQPIDRLSLINRITADYNDDLYKIKLQYEQSKKILDDKFNLAIKQINAICDAYEITLGQLYSYRTKLLKDKLLEFPDFEYSRLNTTLYKSDDINNAAGVEFSVNLNFDIFEVDYSILEYCTNDRDIRRDNIRAFLNAPLTLKFKLDNYNSTSEIMLNNIIFKSTIFYLVIRERDIVILWKYILFRGYFIPYVNIIKISTGLLIYNDICYESDKYVDLSYTTFMYCNRQIIYYYKNSDGEHVFNSYTIDESSDKVKININCLCKLRFGKNHLNYLTRLYSDIRGLYLCCNGSIYFIGKLDKYIDIYDLDNLTQKFNIRTILDTLYNHVIRNIDYSTCEIYIDAIDDIGDKSSYKISLGFSDACNLLY